jgi:hypothetical protein
MRSPPREPRARCVGAVTACDCGGTGRCGGGSAMHELPAWPVGSVVSDLPARALSQ